MSRVSRVAVQVAAGARHHHGIAIVFQGELVLVDPKFGRSGLGERQLALVVGLGGRCSPIAGRHFTAISFSLANDLVAMATDTAPAAATTTNTVVR